MKIDFTISCVSVCPGAFTGKAKVLVDPDDINKVEKDDILVLPRSHPIYALAVMKAAAVVCEVGGRTSHICTITLEMGKPCVTQATNATSLIKDGQYLLINAYEGVIYGYSEAE